MPTKGRYILGPVFKLCLALSLGVMGAALWLAAVVPAAAQQVLAVRGQETSSNIQPEQAEVTPTLFLPLVGTNFSDIHIITITIGYEGWSGAEISATQALLESYQVTHPNLRFAWIQPEDMSTWLSDTIPLGTGPDIVAWYNSAIGKQAHQGHLAPLDAWFNLAYMQATFEPATVQGVRFQNHTWGLPATQEGIALVYNRALISETVLPDPDDFADLADKAAAFHAEHPDQYYFCNPGLGGMDTYHAAPVYFGHGLKDYGGFIAEDGSAYMTTTAALSAAQWIADIRSSAPLTASYPLCESLFISETAAMWWTGPWSLASIQAAGIEYGIAPMGNPFASMRAYMMTSNAVARGKANAVAGVLSYLGSTEAQKQFTLANHTIPANSGALQSPEVQALADIAAFGAALHSSIPESNHLYRDCQWGPVGDATQAIWTGSLVPQAAMLQAQAQINACVQATAP